MQAEIKSIRDNKRWDLVGRPKERKALKKKWVYRVKHEGKENQQLFKARLVVKGFEHEQGVDFTKKISQVLKMSSIRVVLGLIISIYLELEQLYVNTTLLDGNLEEEIYMEQLGGFIEKCKENLVYRLKKSLYGLKQAPCQWYRKFDSFMLDYGFKRINAYQCVYIKRDENGNLIVLLLYFDDMLIFGKYNLMITTLKEELNKTFTTNNLG